MICAKLLVVICATMKLYTAENLFSDFHSAETDEEEKIKEALLLVELLKNEYGKIVRGRDEAASALRSANNSVEYSTCPATISSPENENTTSTITNTTITTTTKTNMTESTTEAMVSHSTVQNRLELQDLRPFRRSWSQAIHPHYEYLPEAAPNYIPNDLPPDVYRRRQRFYRRKIPDYFYYYDVSRESHAQRPFMQKHIPPRPLPFQRNYRRFENNSQLQSIAAETAPTTETPSSAVTVTSPSLNTSAPTSVMAESSSTTSAPLNSSDSTTDTVTRKIIKKHYTKPDKTKTHVRKLRRQTLVKNEITRKDTTTKTEDKDPIIEEVASEYLRELNGTNTKIQKANTKHTTFKLYLEGSTPYAMPLPENHAYCFLNPQSALCRSYI